MYEGQQDDFYEDGQRMINLRTDPSLLPEQDSGVADYMGMFAVACMGCDKMAKEFEDMHDDYSKIMAQVRKCSVIHTPVHIQGRSWKCPDCVFSV